MSIIKAAPASERSLITKFLLESSKQGSFALAQEATSDAIRYGFDAQNFYTQIAAALIVCAGHQVGAHASNFGSRGFRPRWKSSNEIEIPMAKEVYMKELNRRVSGSGTEKPDIKMTDLPNGNVRVNINGRTVDMVFAPPKMVAQMERIKGVLLAEGHVESSAIYVDVPEGRPKDWQKSRRDMPSAPRPGETEIIETHDHIISDRVAEARKQMDTWVDHTIEGNYGAAAESAINAAKNLPLTKLDFLEFTIPIGKLNSEIGTHMAKMGGRQTAGGEFQPHAQQTADGHIQIKVAKPSLVLSDGKTTVDLTQLSQVKNLSPEQHAELQTALQSAGGQALLRRAALQTMEEIIVHGNQFSGRFPLSVVQLEFSLGVAGNGDKTEPMSREWKSLGAQPHKNGMGGAGNPVIFREQEVLSFMYERGAKWADIQEVAGRAAHRDVRRNLLEHLKEKNSAPSTLSPEPKPAPPIEAQVPPPQRPSEVLTKSVSKLLEGGTDATAAAQGAVGRTSLKPEELVWLDHYTKCLKFDPEEAARFNDAFDKGAIKLQMMDREFLNSNTINRRENNMRATTQRILGGTVENYDPLKHDQPIFMVKTQGKNGVEYNVMNGNNRIYLFGRSGSNPNNRAVPVLVFDGPQAFEQVFDFTFSQSKPVPFLFDFEDIPAH